MDQTTTTTATTTVVQPKTPKVVVRVSNIENLLKSAKTLNVTSRKIRRTFEKNTYQKRTQLSVLKRYKRRLDSIEKQEEERRKKASKKKIKLPSIKKFAGSFFAPDASKDPLKAIAALAAFKGLEKLSQGNILGAIGPGLIAAGLVAGPSLLGAGVDKVFNRTPKVRRGFDVTGRRVSASTQQRYLNRYGDKAFKNRFGRTAPQQRTAAARTVSGGGRTAKAFGRLGKSIIPGVGAVLGAVDAKMRAEEGDITGSRIAGASATLDALTAASAATGIGLVAAPFLGLASITLDLVNFARDITGMSENEAKKKKGIQTKLEEQTKKQKEQVNKKKEDKTGLSFAKTLIGYEKVVNKFEEFSKNFKPSSEQTGESYEENIPPRTTIKISDPYTGQITGETFLPLPGATSIGDPNQGQDYGAGRGNRSHQGIDLTETKLPDSRAPVAAFKTGKVIVVERGNTYPGGAIEIHHGGGLVSRYLHVTPEVNVGQTVYGGQQIARLYKYYKNGAEMTHLHFEIYENDVLKDPTPYIKGVKNNITSPLAESRAKQHHESLSPAQPPAQPTPQPAPQPNPTIKPSSKPVNIDGNIFTQKNGKFYKGTEEVPRNYVDAVIKNFKEEFKKEGWISRNIEQYPSYDSTVAVVFVPQPTPTTPSSPPVATTSNPITHIRSLNNDRVIALSMFDSIG